MFFEDVQRVYDKDLTYRSLYYALYHLTVYLPLEPVLFSHPRRGRFIFEEIESKKTIVFFIDKEEAENYTLQKKDSLLISLPFDSFLRPKFTEIFCDELKEADIQYICFRFRNQDKIVKFETFQNIPNDLSKIGFCYPPEIIMDSLVSSFLDWHFGGADKEREFLMELLQGTVFLYQEEKKPVLDNNGNVLLSFFPNENYLELYGHAIYDYLKEFYPSYQDIGLSFSFQKLSHTLTYSSYEFMNREFEKRAKEDAKTILRTEEMNQDIQKTRDLLNLED